MAAGSGKSDHVERNASEVDSNHREEEDDGVDLQALHDKLLGDIRAEQSYWVRNAAKIRAVEQRVESYQQFRDIVDTCHLKPLTKADITRRKEESS